MKAFWKDLVVVVSALTLCAGLAYAGINPNNVGLPTSAPASRGGTDGYDSGLSAIDNNRGSAMCVDCHGRNPSVHLLGNAAARWGSHFVTRTFQDTRGGGGYPGGRQSGLSNPGKYMHRGPWSAAVADNLYVSMGSSKYGLRSGTTVQLDFVPAAATAITDNTPQMICESCHNIVKNVGKDKLLAYAQTTDNNADGRGAYLCVGCHADMNDSVNNEPAYYYSGAGTAVQDHHVNVMTAASGTYTPTFLYKGTSTWANRGTGNGMGVIDNAWYYLATGSRMWAPSPGQISGIASARAISFTVANNPGIRATPITVTNGISVGSDALQCNHCHKPHQAVSSTGALILQSGTGSMTFGLLTTPTSGEGPIVRQSDQGNPKTFANKLMQDDQGLCNGCHQNR